MAGVGFAWVVGILVGMIIHPGFAVLWGVGFGFGPFFIAIAWQMHLKTRKEEGIRYGTLWSAAFMFTDRAMRAVNDEHKVSIRLSGTMMFWCGLILSIAGIPWLMGLSGLIGQLSEIFGSNIEQATGSHQFEEALPATIFVGMSFFVVVGFAGIGSIWRSDFDKQRGTLTLWNWFKRHEFPLSQIHSVLVKYEAPRRGKIGSGQLDTDNAGNTPGETGSAGHGPLWHIYVVMNEGDERYKIHIAKIESRRNSAQRTADAIARVCGCPVRHKE